ncbi:MAG: hypothetical protein U1D67_08695, partial [Dehalococcoidia bacterium]|nr:hypothetical protein [Dehalococcoidia bacterium]
MIRRHSFILTLGGLFLLLAAVTYAVHYAIFKDVHHILIYGVGDLAFLPLEVLIVVLVIEKILARREKQAMLQKLNMVVGGFFMESGNYLLRDLLKYFKNRAEISGHLNVDNNRTKKDFKNAAAFALHLKAEVDYLNIDFPGLKAYLAGKREFLLTLLENPALLEHDLFTDL